MSSESSYLLACVEWAIRAHAGQTRRHTGEPFVCHPVRVASQVARFSPQDAVPAVLHDVLEDTDMGLPSFLSDKDRQTVEILTFDPERHESKLEHLKEIGGDCRARRIKSFDMIDNAESLLFAGKLVPPSLVERLEIAHRWSMYGPVEQIRSVLMRVQGVRS